MSFKTLARNVNLMTLAIREVAFVTNLSSTQFSTNCATVFFWDDWHGMAVCMCDILLEWSAFEASAFIVTLAVLIFFQGN